MLFASNEHRLCLHTGRFAFLSHSPACACGADSVLLSSGYLGACQGGQGICLENMVGDSWWDRARWDCGGGAMVVTAAALQISRTTKQHKPSVHEWGMGCVTCSHRLGAARAMKKFWGFVLFLLLKMFLGAGNSWTDLVGCSLAVLRCFGHGHPSYSRQQPPALRQIPALCSKSWYDELDQGAILPWWCLEPGSALQ